jgi:hypothetical protein
MLNTRSWLEPPIPIFVVVRDPTLDSVQRCINDFHDWSIPRSPTPHTPVVIIHNRTKAQGIEQNEQRWVEGEPHHDSRNRLQPTSGLGIVRHDLIMIRVSDGRQPPLAVDVSRSPDGCLPFAPPCGLCRHSKTALLISCSDALFESRSVSGRSLARHLGAILSVTLSLRLTVRTLYPATAPTRSIM